MNPSARLILVPTPLQEDLPLEPVAQKSLLENCLKENVGILIEDHKVGRQRWLRWGLPREAIDRFILFNEHNQEKIRDKLVDQMKTGKIFYLLSDGGLPAFCDPGQALVHACHLRKIAVTATPFPHSVSLAVALSGFSHREFYFAGFLPANAEERKMGLEKLSHFSCTVVVMDTPYRLQALLKDISSSKLKSRSVFLACDLGSQSEKLFRGSVSEVLQHLGDLNKIEFVLVLAPSF